VPHICATFADVGFPKWLIISTSSYELIERERVISRFIDSG
jgi:hypothetical protein